MLSEARTVGMWCAKNYECEFKFLQVIEDETGDSFLRCGVNTIFPIMY